MNEPTDDAPLDRWSDERHRSDIDMDDDGTPTEVSGVDERTLQSARRAIEAILMVSEEPADPRLLAQLIELPVSAIEALCEQMADDLVTEDRGFRMAQVAGGWRFQSADDLSPYVERFVLTGQSARLSAAALETLAIVAYKQPISRAQVSAIRGVNVDGVMRTLQQRGYIAELARDPGPGQAVLFGTTASFLERLGLNSLSDLPALGEFIPGAEVVEALEAGLRLPDEVVADVENDVEVDVDAHATVEDGGHDDGHDDGDADRAVVDTTDAIDEESDPEPTAESASDEIVIDLRDDPGSEGSEPPARVTSGLDALDVLADEPDAG